MKRPHRSCLPAFVLAAIVLTPLPVYAAAPPRVVALTELAIKPVEVAISSKHLTLIHFETGHVNMVAVGDPAIVSVTVKGPDVLLKALASSGSTNAFIWQGGRYTQWAFTVRQNSKDARLIVVKDLAATVRDGSAGSPEDAGRDGKTAAGSTAAPVASGSPSAGTSAAISVATPAPAQQPPPGSTQQQPSATGAAARDACGTSATLDQFMKTLGDRQRALFSAFLTEPTLARLQTLLLELNAKQRCDLLALLPAPSDQAASDFPKPTGAESMSPGTATQNDNHLKQQTAESQREPEAQRVAGTAPAQPSSSLPAGVALTVTPQIIDGQLFFRYVLENKSDDTLLTDILRLRISDRNGNRLAFRVNRASQDGYIGRLETHGVEYGLIGIDVDEEVLVLEWKLVIQGSGALRLLRMEIQVP